MFSKINTSITERLDARRNGDKGFTLVELLVVVIIIGILAAIAIPVFLNQREAAWRSSVESDVRNAALAVETFATTNNGSIQDITATTLDDTTTPSIEKGENNVIVLEVRADNTYTITGTNPTDLVNEDSDQIVYDSNTGGLGDWN